jgi:2'-5' RNA ligase
VTERARLFVAACPPPDVLDEIAALPRPVDGGVRYTRRDQWHVTLRFLGDAEVADALGAFGRVDAAAADATLGPAVRRLGRNVLVVPVTGLDDLARAVRDATASVGSPPDLRPFTGHVTIARLRGASACRAAGHRIRATFRIDEVLLVRSNLRPDGAVYETVATRPLRAR